MWRIVDVYIVDTYLPSTLCVIMSWISFWIDAKYIPGKPLLVYNLNSYQTGPLLCTIA